MLTFDYSEKLYNRCRSKVNLIRSLIPSSRNVFLHRGKNATTRKLLHNNYIFYNSCATDRGVGRKKLSRLERNIDRR